jgi:predicted O-methyltransferase YrrM
MGGENNKLLPAFLKGQKMKIIEQSWGQNDFLQILNFHKCKIGAEIGVYNGYFSGVLFRHIPNLKLYLIDPYKNFSLQVYQDSANDNQEVQDIRYELICAMFRDKNVEIIRKTSKESLCNVKNESLDFVYIDAAHDYGNVKFDIYEWYKKVKKGGIISGHDYDEDHPGVRQALIEFLKDTNISLFVLRDSRMWYFIKETENEWGSKKNINMF